MNLVTVASTTAIFIGLAAALPQLTCMIRAGSAAGQSRVGWSLGVLVNTLMAYVNLVGYHAVTLAAGNAVSILLCVLAVLLIMRYDDGAAATTATAAPAPAEQSPVIDMPTTEFVMLHAAVKAEARRRELVPA